MPSFSIVFALTAVITILSGGAAALMVTFGAQPQNATRRRVIERLTQIAVAGMAAIVALLTRLSDW